MGKTKQLVDSLIKKRSNGDSFLETSTKFKLLLKGIDADKIKENDPDDPVVIEKIMDLAKIFKIELS